MRRIAFLACVAAVSVLPVRSQQVAPPSAVSVGFRERGKVDVAADATVTQDAPVWVSHEGELDKVGGGDWVLPPAMVLSPGKTEITVRDGSVTVPAEAGTTPTLTEPTDILNRAVFWADATRNVVVSNGEDGVDYVLAWKDARETKSAVPFDYPRAVAQYTVTNLPPQVRQNAAGQDMVYFGGYRSGRWMGFTAQDSETAIWTTPPILHSFIVYRAVASFWYLMGMHAEAASQTYHPENSQAALGACYTTANIATSRANLGARVYLDGTYIDATETKVQAGCKLLEHDFRGLPGMANTFASGYFTSPSRQGGDDLCEVVVFTNRLTEAERLRVESWLMQKWGLAPSASALSFAVARGASVNFQGTAPALAGEGRAVKKGDGAGVFPDMGAQQSFAGTLAVEAGSVSLRDEVSVEAAAGQRLHTGRIADGDHLTVYSDAGIGTIAKSGAGGLRLESVPDDVKKLDVQSGVLTLAASARGTTVAPGSGDASIQDGSFETYTSLGFDTARETAKTVCGWTYGRVPEDTVSDSYALIWNAKNGNNPWTLPRLSADGNCVMIFRYNSYAYTEVTIPQDGTYELSFAIMRRSNGYNPYLDVYFGPDADSLAKVTRATALPGAFEYESVTLPDVKAGTHRLEFRSVGADKNYSPILDDVKMRLVSRPAKAFLIPNGGFEEIEKIPVSYSTLASKIITDNVPRGWSLTTSPRIGLALPGTTNVYGVAYQRAADLREGRIQLFMASTGTVATATFKPTRTGTFRLQADAGRWGYWNNYYYDGIDVVGTPCIHTAIQIGDAAPIALGSLSRPYQRMETLTWPTAFTITDTNATVTLTVSNSVHNGAAMLDNFAFLPYQDETELVTDGGFEANGTWTLEAPENDTSNTSYSYCAARRQAYSGDPQYYGYARYEGDYRLRLTDRAFATQEIAFPAEGRYRLRFHVSERTDSRYTPEHKGLCPYRAWIARDGVTNVIGRSTASTSNYVAHTWRFTVPDASAPWTFGFEAVNEVSSSNKDRTAFIDGVSIMKDETDEEETPNLPEKLEVSVAAGAELRLEFTGTNRIDRLSLGGRSVSGIVSAATHPDYITGDGAFEILPKGTMLLFR